MAYPTKRRKYQRARIKLPRPEFIVLYNGTGPFPDRQAMRLSDAFETVEGFDETNLELAVTAYNINHGRNAEMASRSEELRGYAYFVNQVRLHGAAEKQADAAADPGDVTIRAIRKAIQDCKDQGLLLAFWDNLKPEELNMIGSEWDLNMALEVEREEGREEGIEIGLEKGREERDKEIAERNMESARYLHEYGMATEQIADALKLPLEKVDQYLRG